MTTFSSKNLFDSFCQSAAECNSWDKTGSAKSLPPQMESPDSHRCHNLDSSICWFLSKGEWCWPTSKNQPAGRIGARPGNVGHLPELPGGHLQVFPQVFNSAIVVDLISSWMSPGALSTTWGLSLKHCSGLWYGEPLIGPKEAAWVSGFGAIWFSITCFVVAVVIDGSLV